MSMCVRSITAIWFTSSVLAGASATVAGDPNSMKPLPVKEWDREKAAHLLRRAGFGGSPAEIDRLFEMGPEAAVSGLIDYHKIEYEVAPPYIDPMVRESPRLAEQRLLSDEERREYQQKRQMAERRTLEEVRLWWIERMARSPRPFEEKMTLFWHGHFTSGAREVRRALFMYEQNEFMRRNAVGNFRDLVIGISKDRAMLLYLDAARSTKRQPNENYARELMELFTLGVGNYSEADIKAAARAFTGWGFDDDGFDFRPRQHDNSVKTFLGKTGPLNGEDVIDIILAQPACARWISRCLLEFYVRPDPEKPLVEAFAGVLRRNKFELRPSLKTLFRSEAFYHEKSRGSLIKSPVELVVGAARQLDVPLEDLLGAERSMSGMGQELLQPPNVKGWDGGQKWINTATLFSRYNYAGKLLRGEAAADNRARALARAVVSKDEEPDEKMAMTGISAMQPSQAKSRLTAGRPAAFDPMILVRRYELSDAEEIVKFFAAHLLAAPLPDGKQERLIHYLSGGGKSPFSITAPDAADRIRTMVHLLCSTPEFQLN